MKYIEYNKHLDQNIGILLFIYKQNEKIIFIINLHMLHIYIYLVKISKFLINMFESIEIKSLFHHREGVVSLL